MKDIDNILLNFTPSSLILLNAILAIVMFSIALDLRKDDFTTLLAAPKPLLTGLTSQFIVLPTVTYLMIVAVEPRASIALGLILIAACPGGNISNFITHMAGGNTALSVSMTAFATVSATLLTPINIAFWGSLYPPTREILAQTSIDPIQIAITITFMLFLPLVIGIWLNTTKPEMATRVRRPMQILSMVIFVTFVVLALAANWSFFLSYAWMVAGLVLLHNALALGSGFTIASVMRLSPYNRRAITIETGIQNSGLGLVLIFGFFNGLGGMAVVAAFWGIWHAISGMALAKFLSRTEAQR